MFASCGKHQQGFAVQRGVGGWVEQQAAQLFAQRGAARLTGQQRVDALCQHYLLPGQARPALPQRQLHGMAMGFADLVFAHGGRYWVLDYKTNTLGPDGSAYTPTTLAAAMLQHRYDVQAALYTLALHRLLRQRLGAAYRPEDHLGGALYLFMRGLDGTWMQHLPIPSALLDALEALITAPAEACA